MFSTWKVVDSVFLTLKWLIHVFPTRKVVDVYYIYHSYCPKHHVASHYGEDERRMCMGKLSKTHCFLLPICSMACSYPRFIRQIIFIRCISLYHVSWRPRGGAEIYIHQVWISALNRSAWSTPSHATPRPGRSIPWKEPRSRVKEAGWSSAPA